MFKKFKNNAICHLISVMWKHGEGYRLRIVLCTAAAVCAVLLTLMFPLVMSKVMNAIEVQQGDALVATTGKYLLVYMVVSFSFLLVHAPSRVIETVVGYEVRRVMQVSLFRKVTLMPMSWHKRHHSGETIYQVAKA